MKTKVLGAALAGALLASPVSAATISGNGTGDTSEDYAFAFAGLPQATGPGSLSLTLQGDFSPRSSLSEFARLGFDTAPGVADLNNNGSNAIVFSNSISGLTLASSSLAGSGNNVTLNYVFDVSQSLLASVLGDGAFTLFVDLASDVNGPNSVRFQLDYEDDGTAPPVPIPASLPLLLGGLGLLGWRARKAN